MIDFNVPQMLRSEQRVPHKRRIVLRAIRPTLMHTQQIADIYVNWLDKYWAKIKAHVLAIYQQNVGFMTDSATDVLSSLYNIAEDVGLFSIFRNLFRQVGGGIVAWHTKKFIANMKRATKINLSNMLVVDDVAPTVEDFIDANMVLLRSVAEQAQGRVALVLTNGLRLESKVATVQAEIHQALQLSIARAKRIAFDQINKFTSMLDYDRHSQTGIDGFIWEHSRKIHYRPWHKARDGKFFAWDSEVAKTDPPGQAPFCGCRALGVLEV